MALWLQAYDLLPEAKQERTLPGEKLLSRDGAQS